MESVGKTFGIDSRLRGGARKVCALVEQSVPPNGFDRESDDIPFELNSGVIRGTLRQWNVIHARRYDDIVLRRL